MRRSVAGVCAALSIGVVILCGCGRHAATDTGAKQAAQQYLEAFGRQDWPQAYAVLDADSRAHRSADQYTQWVTEYRHRLGFDVETAVVVSCRETGEKAVVEVALSGHAGNRKRTKDMALSLRRDEGHWGIVLPAAVAH